MPMSTCDILGSDQIGIYLAVCGNVVFHPNEIREETVQIIENNLGLERVPISIGGSNLIGALVAGNSRGLAVADIATESDIDKLTSYGDVIVMEGGVNTAGNLILCNENGAIVSPALPDEGVEIISEIFGTPVAASSIAGEDIVGSLGVATNQGVLLHPDVLPDEVLLIEEVLGVPPMVGTVAFGSPYVGAGIAASDNGAITGRETTGPELNRIEDALGLI
ncbi:MAG: translation initiation factor IF-6 [Euryarchaeota archaeon]|nr:translation initiation factor IF-6 [Euryarchaeota archaeon]